MTTLGEAPSGLRDVFELCRGFERAFTNIVNVRAGGSSWGRWAEPSSGGGRRRAQPRVAHSTRVCRGIRMASPPCMPPPPPQESPAANKIKEAFFSEKGLAGNVQKLPLEKVFELESIKKVGAAVSQSAVLPSCRVQARTAPWPASSSSGGNLCSRRPSCSPRPPFVAPDPQITKIADGYQPHMVSPERGLRLMATRALDQVEGPVTTCVSAVYSMLVSAAREAAAVAGEHTEAALAGKVPLNVPEFKNFIMPAVIRALDEWRLEAEKSGGGGPRGGGRGTGRCVEGGDAPVQRLRCTTYCLCSWRGPGPQPQPPGPTPPPPDASYPPVSKMLVDMERSYITAGFFRYTMYRRYSAMQQQNVLQAALAKGQAKSQKKGLASFLPGGGGGADQVGGAAPRGEGPFAAPRAPV